MEEISKKQIEELTGLFFDRDDYFGIDETVLDCSYCRGKGTIRHKHEEYKCPVCEGRGYVYGDIEYVVKRIKIESIRLNCSEDGTKISCYCRDESGEFLLLDSSFIFETMASACKKCDELNDMEIKFHGLLRA